MTKIKLYCEGIEGSHDYDILIKLTPIDITPTPIGSKKGAGTAIATHQILGADKFDYYIFFRDRDFDKDLREYDAEGKFTNYRKESLITDSKDYKKDTMQNIVGQWCFSYRTTIENYLFDSKLFYEFLVHHKLVTKNKITSEEEVKQRFIKAANLIKDYQAIRHTLGEMREHVDFGTKWTNKSGELPKKLDKSSCRIEALSQIKNAKSLTEKWDSENFDKKLEIFLNIFDTDFMNRLDFLIWFQGKDFASALSKEFMPFSMDNYYKFAKTHFDYTQFPDLVELRTLLQNKLQ